MANVESVIVDDSLNSPVKMDPSYELYLQKLPSELLEEELVYLSISQLIELCGKLDFLEDTCKSESFWNHRAQEIYQVPLPKVGIIDRWTFESVDDTAQPFLRYLNLLNRFKFIYPLTEEYRRRHNIVTQEVKDIERAMVNYLEAAIERHPETYYFQLLFDPEIYSDLDPRDYYGVNTTRLYFKAFGIYDAFLKARNYLLKVTQPPQDLINFNDAFIEDNKFNDLEFNELIIELGDRMVDRFKQDSDHDIKLVTTEPPIIIE